MTNQASIVTADARLVRLPVDPPRGDAIQKFAALKARKFDEQAFGDSRVEDAANVLEDVSAMIDNALKSGGLSDPARARQEERHG